MPAPKKKPALKSSIMPEIDPLLIKSEENPEENSLAGAGLYAEEQGNPSIADQELADEADQQAARDEEYQAAIDSLSKDLPQETPPQKAGLLEQAIIGLAPAVIGNLAGGNKGGAIGAEAGLTGLKTLRDLEKEEAKNYTLREMKRLATQGKSESARNTQTTELRKERTSHPTYKNTEVVSSSWDKMKEVLKQKKSGAGDLALMFSYMKMLDPGSVVREGEQALAVRARGIADSLGFGNLWDSAKKGTTLTNDQRKDFMMRAKDLLNAQMRRQNQLDSDFSNIAGKQGIDPNDILLTSGFTRESAKNPQIPTESEDHSLEDIQKEKEKRGLK